MTIALTGSGGLFTRLGKVAKMLRLINTHQATTIPDSIEEIMAEYDTLRDAPAILPGQDLSNRQGAGNIYSALKQVAENTVLEMVKADKPARATSLAAAILEIRDQMAASGDDVKACTVACSAAALSTNSGNGTIVITTKRGDGKVQENIVAEVCPLICLTDSQTGSATEGQEVFAYAGEEDDGDPSLDDWPTGSGALATITAIPADQDATAGNVLTNSDFETWSGSPLKATGWGTSPVVGVWGTDIARTTTKYRGTYGLSFVGDGSTLSAIQQQFNDSSVGTAGELLPSRSYAANFFGRVSATPSTGILTVSLVDGSGTVIADDAGTNNTQTFDMTAWTTSFVAKNVVFRMPKLIPDTVYLRIKVSTALENGKTAYIDELAMGLVQSLYDGGPGVAIFGGSTKFVAGDGWNLTSTNNRGGATYNSTFQTVFDRLFGMRALGLLLPSDASPTVADTLITA